MTACAGCRAGKPRYSYVAGKGFVPDARGKSHMIKSFNHTEFMTCTRQHLDCVHEYELFQHCDARVCLNCGDHVGKNKCERCGWKRKHDIIQTVIDEDITLERLLDG